MNYKVILTATFIVVSISVIAHADCSRTYDEGLWKFTSEDIVESVTEIDQFGSRSVHYISTGTQYSISVSSNGIELKFSIDQDGLYGFISAQEDVSTCRVMNYSLDGNGKKAKVYAANDYTLGIENSMNLLLALLGHDSLTVQYSTLWDDPREVIFDVGGIENAIDHILPFNTVIRKKVERFIEKRRIKRKMECKP